MANDNVNFKWGSTIEGKTVEADDLVAINQSLDEATAEDASAALLGSFYKGDKILGTTEADKLCLTEDLEVVGVTVGNVSTGKKWGKGTDLATILKSILAKEISVTATNPSVTVSNSGTPNAGTYEVGTSISVDLGHTYTDGRFVGQSGYNYNIAAQCDEGTTTYTKNGSDMESNTDTMVLTESTVNYKCKTTYSASKAEPVTNFRNPAGVSIPANTSGVVSSNSITFTGAYKYFMGYSTNTTAAEFDSASVRALTVKTGNITNNGTTTIVNATAIASDGTSIVIACPSKYKLATVQNGLGADILANFSSQGNVTVTTGTIETEYKLFIYPITNGAVVEFKNVTLTKA